MKKAYEAPRLRKAGTLSAVTAQQGSSNFKEEVSAGPDVAGGKTVRLKALPATMARRICGKYTASIRSDGVILIYDSDVGT